MRKVEPKEIAKGRGSVKDSKYYSGLAATLKTGFGEVVIIAKDFDSLIQLCAPLMNINFKLDKRLIQTVCVFDEKTVNKLTTKESI